MKVLKNRFYPVSIERQTIVNCPYLNSDTVWLKYKGGSYTPWSGTELLGSRAYKKFEVKADILDMIQAGLS